MASDRKKVTLEVAVETEQAEIAALEKKLDEAKQKAAELKQQKIQMQINADTEKLSEVKSKIAELENKKAELKVGVDDAEIDATEREIESLKQEQVNLELNIEKHKLDEIKSEMDAIEADPIEVQLNNQSAMEGLNQIADGFSRIKSAAGEVASEFGDLLSSAGKQETNFAFLKNAVGDAETARQKMQEINDIVAQLPGDDTALQGLLSSAAAKDSSLTADNLRSMANSATDYFSAMSYYGKSATEAQQDMTNYLLAGNTAELERSPILQGHIDKLKEANTVQERANALAEALNEEHWGGMGAMDTYNNKLETFNGMIERGRYTLGGMFQEGAKSGMDFLLKLDESTNGLVGMTIAAGGFLSPVTDAVMGLGQMATGIKAVKDAADFTGITSKLGSIKTKAIEAATTLKTTLVGALKGAADAARNAASWLATAGKKALEAGINAARSAIGWLAEKAAKLASEAASKLAAAAQWLLNAAMAANPIVLVTIAIIALIAVLGYLYFNNEQVRAAVDGLGQALWGLGESIYGSLMGAFEWLQGAWQNTVNWFTDGGQYISDAVIGTFNWISETIMGTLGAALQWLQESWQGVVDWFSQGGQTIQDTLGGAWQWLTDSFNNVVNTITTYAPLVAQILFVMATGGVGAIVLLVANFMGMPNQVGGALQNIITRVVSFAGNLVNNLRNAAVNAVSQFASGIGRLGDALKQELQGMLNDAANFVGQIGQIMWNAAVNAWNNFLSGLQRNSPGKMMREFKAEVTGLVDIAHDANDPLGSTMKNLANTAVNSWGNPNLKYSIELEKVSVLDNGGFDNSRLEDLLNQILTALNGNSNVPNSITFNHYGDTDKEEKLQEILDFIVREMNFDNSTAGRTV